MEGFGGLRAFSGQIWSVSPVNALPAPELVVRSSEQLKVLEQRRTEKEARRSKLVLAMLLAGAAFAYRRDERIGGGARFTTGFRGCSLTVVGRRFAGGIVEEEEERWCSRTLEERQIILKLVEGK